MKITMQARWLEFNYGGFGHRQQIRDALLRTGDSLVLLGGEQHVGRRPRSVMKTGPFFAALFALLVFWLNSRQDSLALSRPLRIWKSTCASGSIILHGVAA